MMKANEPFEWEEWMKNKKIWLFSMILLIAVSLMIFIFSAQNGEKSALFSEHFTENFVHLFGITDVDAGKAEHFLRKTAHFAEFFLLGALLSAWLFHFKKGFLFTGMLSFGISFAYAVLDEGHQYFIPGRSASVKDVLLDGAGALCGIFFALCLRFLIGKYQEKRKNVNLPYEDKQ